MSSKYCFSFDDERFEGGFDDAFAAAFEAFDQDDERDVVYVGEVKPVTEFMTPQCIGNHVIEMISEMLGDEVGEAAENFEVSKLDLIDLGDVILKWVEDHGGFKCWGVKNVRTFYRKDTEGIDRNLVLHIADALNWVCDCGALCNPSDASWRWNGEAWEHSHGGQAGHFVATRKAAP